MLKGTCQWPKCKAVFQWDPPLIIESDLYVVGCPKCNFRHLVEDGKIVATVQGKEVAKEVKYTVWRIETNGKHYQCLTPTPVSYEEAKNNVEAGNDLCKQKGHEQLLTYYMKPVLDGLA